MDRKDVIELLDEAFYTEMRILEDTIGGPYRNTARASLKVYQRSKLTEKCTSIICDDPDLIRWDHLQTKNLSLACVLDEPGHEILLVGSGIARTNPAVVELTAQNGQVEIRAWAKEGLIKQRTAEKAVNAVRSVLECSEN